MCKGTLLVLASALCVLTIAHSAAARQQFSCGEATCDCRGAADCGELVASGFCETRLKCGAEYGLPPGECFCVATWVRKGPTGLPRPGGPKPDSREP
jgi:hypothetical protein